MKTNLDCVYCILKKSDERYGKLESDNVKKLAFMKEVFLVLGKSSDNTTSPYLTKCVNRLIQDEFGQFDDYAEFKKGI